MDNLNLRTKVSVNFKGANFIGEVSGVEGPCYIVKIIDPTKEVLALRNDTFDPPGCLVVHRSFVVEIVK